MPILLMEPQTEKFSDATANRPEGKRPLDAAVMRFSLPHYIRQLKDEKAWTETTRNAITLLHNSYMRIVLVALKSGQEMCHGIAGALSVHVLSGRINLETEQESFSMDEGDIATLHPGLRHFIFAEGTAVILLTLAGNASGDF
ncbi:MAG: hypothetical protein JST06_11980 [Bacteroidetes bacterium]|nr:hypothetical protein [Bacteroidota bacterium]MBS1630106.1 hypothetical protein [Bacteroidota bacterium]